MSTNLVNDFVNLAVGPDGVPDSYTADGSLDPHTDIGTVAHKIRTELDELLEKIRPDNPTERWTASEEILRKHMFPSTEGPGKVADDVESAKKLETKYFDDSASSIKRGDNPYEWAIEVSVDRQGDLQAGCTVYKGWRWKGSAGEMVPVRPRVFAHRSENEDVRDLYTEYGWDPIWNEDGTLKLLSELEQSGLASRIVRSAPVNSILSSSSHDLAANMFAQNVSEPGQEEGPVTGKPESEYSYDSEGNSDWEKAKGSERDDASDDGYIKL